MFEKILRYIGFSVGGLIMIAKLTAIGAAIRDRRIKRRQREGADK